MKKIIYGALALLIVGSIANSWYKKDKSEKQVQVDKVKRSDSVKAAIKDLVTKTDANDEWVAVLGKGRVFRSAPIFTVELEKVWLTGKPILFIGAIEDVTTYDDTLYTVVFNRSSLHSSGYFKTKLKLSLLVHKSVFDAFLKNHPSLSDNGTFNDGVAVVAKVDEISESTSINEDGDEVEIKTGVGSLLDVAYTGEEKL